MIFSYSRLHLFKKCPFRFFKKYVEGYEEPITESLALGKAVHKTIEDKINGIEHAEAVLNGYIECDFHPEVKIETISYLASNANVNPKMGETEVYFELTLDENNEGTKIRGYVDLVEDGGKHITDWKTNHVLYSVRDTFQLGIYAWAVHKMFRVKEVVGTVYFLRHKKASSYIFDMNDMENARQWALGLANAIHSKLKMYSMFPESKDDIFPACPSSNCRHCPFALECFQTFKVC